MEIKKGYFACVKKDGNIQLVGGETKKQLMTLLSNMEDIEIASDVIRGRRFSLKTRTTFDLEMDTEETQNPPAEAELAQAV